MFVAAATCAGKGVLRVVAGACALLAVPAALAQDVALPPAPATLPALTLEAAEAAALRSQPVLAAAQLRARAQGERARQARADFQPQMVLNVTAATVESTGNAQAAGNVTTSALAERFAAGVTLSQLITDFGRTANTVHAAVLATRAAERDADTVRNQTLLRVATAYYRVLAAESVRDAAGAALSNIRQLRRLPEEAETPAAAAGQSAATAKSAAAGQGAAGKGSASRAELEQTTAAVLEADAALAVSRAAAEVAGSRAQLAETLGSMDPVAAPLVDAAELPAPPPEVLQPALVGPLGGNAQPVSGPERGNAAALGSTARGQSGSAAAAPPARPGTVPPAASAQAGGPAGPAAAAHASATAQSAAEPLVAAALGQRPELSALEARKEAAAASARASSRALLPVVTALGTAGSIPTHDRQLQDDYGAAAINISVPLWNGFQLTARRNEAALLAAAAARDLQAQRLRVASEVRTAAAAVADAWLRVGLTARQADTATRALELARAHYADGTGTLAEWNLAQGNATRATIDRAAARFDYLSRRAALDYATGSLH